MVSSDVKAEKWKQGARKTLLTWVSSAMPKCVSKFILSPSHLREAVYRINGSLQLSNSINILGIAE